jgi:hypothetical protein
MSANIVASRPATTEARPVAGLAEAYEALAEKLERLADELEALLRRAALRGDVQAIVRERDTTGG